MPKRLLIDCSSGISGDMFLSALASLGVNFSALEELFKQAGLDVTIRLEHITRMAGPGLQADISWPDEQPLRHLADLAEIVAKLSLSSAVKQKAVDTLTRLGQAEATVHDEDVSQVHFHEVGAIDTLVDVLGAVWGLEQLGVKEVWCGPLPWFGGFVDCSHGRLALPAPATAELLKGKPVFMTSAQEELITPTGAVLLDSLVTKFTPAQAGPAGTYQGSGQGYGSREPSAESDWPGRGLRLHLFQLQDLDGSSQYIMDEVMQLSSHIDHLTGEEIGHAIQMLNDAGALDVFWFSALTKKNRPGGELRVICRPEELPRLQTEFFKHTHSLGIRVSKHYRVTLPRRESTLESQWGPLDAKEYELLNQTFTKAEYEALVKAAADMGIGLPALRVQEKRR